MNKGDAVYTIYSIFNDIYTEGISSPSPQFLAKIKIQPRSLLESSTGTTTRVQILLESICVSNQTINIHLSNKNKITALVDKTYWPLINHS